MAKAKASAPMLATIILATATARGTSQPWTAAPTVQPAMERLLTIEPPSPQNRASATDPPQPAATVDGAPTDDFGTARRSQPPIRRLFGWSGEHRQR